MAAPAALIDLLPIIMQMMKMMKKNKGGGGGGSMGGGGKMGQAMNFASMGKDFMPQIGEDEVTKRSRIEEALRGMGGGGSGMPKMGMY